METERLLPADHVDEAWVVVAVGLGFAIVGGTHLPNITTEVPAARQVLTAALFVGVPLVAVGAGLYASHIYSEFEWVVTQWCLVATAPLVVLSVWLDAGVVFGGAFGRAIRPFLLAGNFGVALGTVIDLNRAQARRNARVAERERTQRKGLVLVTHLLHHHVRNGMTIVNGYADELREDAPDEQVEAIQSQADRVVNLVDNVRTLTRSLAGETEIRPIDVDRIAAETVEETRETYSEADIDLEADDATASTDEHLRAVLKNLLSNAIEHNDRDNPSIEVEVTDGDPVEIRVLDDGPGIPDAVKESMADPDPENIRSRGDEFGLYLVRALVGRYGGTVSMEDREPRGTAVIIELPPA